MAETKITGTMTRYCGGIISPDGKECPISFRELRAALLAELVDGDKVEFTLQTDAHGRPTTYALRKI